MKLNASLLLLLSLGACSGYDPFREREIGRFRPGERPVWEPQWSEDGARVVYVTRKSGMEELYLDGHRSGPAAACY